MKERCVTITAMQWACGESLLNGRDGDMLVPKGNAARAEAAAVFHRFLTNRGA